MSSNASHVKGGSQVKESSPALDNIYITTFEEEDDVSCGESFRYWWFNCLINGIFATPRTIGYTQFMVFMILRVIISGSLCGRIFGSDPYTINCSFVSDQTTTLLRRSISSTDRGVEINNESDINSSYEVKKTCLNSTYSNVSPIIIWALSVLTVLLPWLVLLPWTPTKDDQDYIVCKPTKLQWPCLTIYAVRFMKACVRLVLEFFFVIIIPILYGWRIPSTLTCYDGEVTCYMAEQANEKTHFLWFFAAVNFMSCCLTAIEIVDITRNKHVYETERTGYASSSKLSSNRSSTATMLAYQQKKEVVDKDQLESNGLKEESQGNCKHEKKDKKVDLVLTEPKRRKSQSLAFRQMDDDAVINLLSKSTSREEEELNKDALGYATSIINDVIIHTTTKDFVNESDTDGEAGQVTNQGDE